MAKRSLEAVLNHPGIWRGSDCARMAVPGIPTGFAELDRLLPGAGWPSGALTEILVERCGVGELQLLMPAMARLTANGRWLAIVSPPHIPYAPAFAARGVHLERLMLVRTTSACDSLWACEQALRAPCCGIALLWLDRFHERALRRLQLAAEDGGTTLILFRSARAAPVTMATLRLHVSRAQNRTLVNILKRRGGGLPPPLMLDLHGIAMQPHPRMVRKIARPLPVLP